MREVTVTANNVGDSDPVVLDQYQNPFNVSYVVNGTGTVQVTLTDPYPVENQDFVEATYTWVTAPQTAPNAAGFLGQPYRAIRLYDANPGDTLTVVQSGVKG